MQGTEKNKIDVAHFLLNMSSEAKEDFCKAIHHALRRQPEIGRMAVMSAFGEIKYCLFVSTTGIKIMDIAERQDYVLSAILSDESMPIMWINLDYDKDGNLLDVKGNLCSYCDIPANDIDRLKELSVEYTTRRNPLTGCHLLSFRVGSRTLRETTINDNSQASFAEYWGKTSDDYRHRNW